MSIDSSARIDPKAEIDSDVTIGPWTIVGPNVQIGSGTVIDSHVVIRANTKIGKGNRIFQFSSVGEDPADLKFEGEETWLEIGDNNVLREGSNFHRGTGFGGGLTRVGSDNLFMPYVHIAHDCMVGNNTIFSNNVGISGHVEVGDWVILGGYAGVNQYLQIGAHAFVGGVTHIDHDVPAYMIVAGQPARVRAVNAIGLERRGFDKDTIKRLRTAYKIVFMRGLGLSEAVDELKAMPSRCDAVQVLIDSLEASKKGIHR